jgi:hypothetical protein
MRSAGGVPQAGGGQVRAVLSPDPVAIIVPEGASEHTASRAPSGENSIPWFGPKVIRTMTSARAAPVMSDIMDHVTAPNAPGDRISRAVLAAARASGYEPHDDEDGQRYQRDDDERLERGEDPARNRDDKPDGEDRAEDCPDDPAHVPIMLPAA